MRCPGLLSAAEGSGLAGWGSERTERRVSDWRGRIFCSPMLEKAAAAKAKMPPDLGLLVPEPGREPTEGWLACWGREWACSTDETSGRCLGLLKGSLRASLAVDDASWRAGDRDA